MRKNNCLFLAVVAGIVVLAILVLQRRNDEAYQLEIVNTGAGTYGYRILHEGKTVIYQPFVPAVSGKQAFRSEKEALKVGRLVMQRLQAGEDFAVTPDDLHGLGMGH